MERASPLIVGISGATGIIYGIRTLQLLREAGVTTHLVLSKAAEMTLAYETTLSVRELRDLADVSYAVSDVGATIASGSFLTRGMIIAPCSIKTMSEIAHGITASLMSRAADVVLKERRRLVLLVRETPLTTTHLRNMLLVTESGGIIAPPAPAFYTHPQTIEEIVDQTVGRTLDLFDIDVQAHVKRWKKEKYAQKKTPTLERDR